VALVFERLEGRTLDQVIADRGRLPTAEIKRVLEPVCDALEYAHARGVVHRDLKPANVMLLTGGGVKMLDFGISRRAAGKAAVTQSVVGTPHYMARSRSTAPSARRATCSPWARSSSRWPPASAPSRVSVASSSSAATTARRAWPAELPRSFDLLIDARWSRTRQAPVLRRGVLAELAKIPDVIGAA